MKDGLMCLRASYRSCRTSNALLFDGFFRISEIKVKYALSCSDRLVVISRVQLSEEEIDSIVPVYLRNELLCRGYRAERKTLSVRFVDPMFLPSWSLRVA